LKLGGEGFTKSHAESLYSLIGICCDSLIYGSA
jgi:hypothetical protein